MAITAAGVGSGLDINGIVTQLMQLERQPVFKLQSQVRSYESQLSAYGKIRSALSSFESAMEGLGSLDKFKVFAAASSDESIVTASADSSAASGIYSVDVLRLAQNHKLGSSETDLADTFSGNLDITIGGETLSVNTNGLTLTGIRDAINADSSNPGLTATIINTGGTSQRLILTSDESGTANSITVDETAVNNVTQGITGSALGLAIANRDKDGVLLGSTAELDASYTIDGYALTASSNDASGVIDGITLSLKDLGTSTLNLSRDTEAIKESAQEFVDAYNNLYSTLNQLGKNELSGDSSVRSIQSAVRSVYNTAPVGLTGSFSSLVQIGLNSDAKTGELSLDSADFEQALDTDFQSVAELFANDDQGFAFRLADIADTLLENDGIVKSREEGIRSRIDNAEDDILSWEARLELKETALRAKYAGLDAMIGSMQSTMSFVARL